jgi:hypothetical protein
MNNIRQIIEERLDNARNDWLLDKRDYLRGQMVSYRDCLNLFPAPRTEEEILKDFEKLGYEVKQNNDFCLIMINDKTDEVISILKRDTFTISMGYRKYIKDEDYLATFITMQEHKLLSELFEVWQWI